MRVASSTPSGNSESGHHKIDEAFPISPSKQSYRKDSARQHLEIGDNAAGPTPEGGIGAHICASHSQKPGHKIHSNQRSQSTLPQLSHLHHPSKLSCLLSHLRVRSKSPVSSPYHSNIDHPPSPHKRHIVPRDTVSHMCALHRA